MQQKVEHAVNVLPNEILNINYNTRRLVIKALNKYPSKVEAHQALGISERSLYRKIIEFRITKDKVKGYQTVPFDAPITVLLTL